MAARIKRADLIQEEYRDSDGYWIYLKYGWKDGSDPIGCVHGIVEDTKRDAYRRLAGVIPCDCAECRQATAPPASQPTACTPPEPGACSDCHRIEERTDRGIRKIRLDENGICAACRDAIAEAEVDARDLAEDYPGQYITGPDRPRQARRAPDNSVPQAARKMWS